MDSIREKQAKVRRRDYVISIEGNEELDFYLEVKGRLVGEGRERRGEVMGLEPTHRDGEIRLIQGYGRLRQLTGEEERLRERNEEGEDIICLEELQLRRNRVRG